MKTNSIKRYLPDKKQFWNFVFVILGAIVIYFFVDSKTIELSQTWTEQQEIAHQKAVFVEKLSVLGFSRVYYAEVYYLNKTSNESAEVIDKSFELYIDSVAEWNKQNVLNSIFLNKYFGEDVKNNYNDDLLPTLISLHQAVLDIRDNQNVQNFKETLEKAKNKMFVFNENLY